MQRKRLNIWEYSDDIADQITGGNDDNTLEIA